MQQKSVAHLDSPRSFPSPFGHEKQATEGSEEHFHSRSNRKCVFGIARIKKRKERILWSPSGGYLSDAFQSPFFPIWKYLQRPASKNDWFGQCPISLYRLGNLQYFWLKPQGQETCRGMNHPSPHQKIILPCFKSLPRLVKITSVVFHVAPVQRTTLPSPESRKFCVSYWANSSPFGLPGLLWSWAVLTLRPSINQKRKNSCPQTVTGRKTAEDQLIIFY